MSDKLPYASGQRQWNVERVRWECPLCYHEHIIDPGELDVEELWYGHSIEVECEGCGHKFGLEIDDDDR